MGGSSELGSESGAGVERGWGKGSCAEGGSEVRGSAVGGAELAGSEKVGAGLGADLGAAWGRLLLLSGRCRMRTCSHASHAG